ncbi:hypothetical protein BJ085DRAFT_37157 [Dimargaris cristalligena]|uniref:DHHA2 domain-containing protein n=1 Tax=Dimargaris cristalligena TaxID=215637 RepID=A0A4P9ZPZ0_9FUNG|nr:hypothetical protein BJ085DRAFT_37157 [Dimargaris cristalligena]|eukprot:RKP34682.1 hypothetical protein BJ085DRAFT_37157 [Dimargaris cristalligena]
MSSQSYSQIRRGSDYPPSASLSGEPHLELSRFITSFTPDLELLVKQILDPKQPRLVITMGTEAADLDSMVTAITYSYWRHLNDLTKGTQAPAVYIPLINIPAADFKIRPECVRVLEQTGRLDPKLLVFEDSPVLASLFGRLRDNKSGPLVIPADRLEIILVDHNKPNDYQPFLAPYVRAILDHHEDKQKFPEANPRWVTTVGSATTLTTLEGYQLLGGTGHTTAQASATNPTALDGFLPDLVRHQPNLFHMLLAPILVDTGNLDPNNGQLAPMDQEAIDVLWRARPRLETMLPSQPPRNSDEVYDLAAEGKPFPIALPTECQSNSIGETDEACRTAYLSAWFHDIDTARKNVIHLTGAELLRKDYKSWTMGPYNVGISAVIMSFKQWIGRDSTPVFEQSIHQTYLDRKVDLFAVMTMYSDEHDPTQLRRELLVYAPELRLSDATINDPKHQHFRKLLEDLNAAPELNLEPYRPTNNRKCFASLIDADSPYSQTLDTKGYVVYNQRNIKSSRKKMQPLMTKSLSQAN